MQRPPNVFWTAPDRSCHNRFGPSYGTIVVSRTIHTINTGLPLELAAKTS